MADWDRDNPWRQGCLLTPETVQALDIKHHESPEATAIVVISHDCDLAQSCQGEPDVEVIVGRYVDEPQGNFTHAKNLRKLHLPYTRGSQQAVVELLANGKRTLPKEGQDGLADHQPDMNIKLGPEEQAILQSWLAARYRRAAFPDEFDRRLNEETGLREQLAKILKSHGMHIPAIFFDVDEGEEVKRNGADDVYTLSVYLLYSTQNDPDTAETDAQKAKAAIEAAFKKKCVNGKGKWQWIELRECDILADTAMTYAQSLLFKKWQADHISFRSDPQQELFE